MFLFWCCLRLYDRWERYSIARRTSKMPMQPGTTNPPMPSSAATLFPMGRWLVEHRAFVTLGAIAIVAVNLWVWGLGRNAVLSAAYAVPERGGYCGLDESGVAETIKHNGSVILPASGSGGSYCCGFTFAVAMDVAQDRGLLKDKSTADVRRFQKVWYGSLKGSAAKQCAQAVTELGIGREIHLDDARPGDFIAFTRKNGSGHSVVFLDWVKSADGDIFGFRYRSSQPRSSGVGDAVEFFVESDMGPPSAAIDRDLVAVARLNRRWWSRVLYPFIS